MLDNLLFQLLEFYYKYDAFQVNYLEEEKIKKIYKIMLERNRIHSCLDENGFLLGYGESWRINYEQFGRIICGHNLYNTLESEDISTGNICYLANVTIHPAYRNSEVIRSLRNDFFLRNQDAEYFVGHAKRKKTQPVKVFTRQEAFMKWAKGESNGR